MGLTKSSLLLLAVVPRFLSQQLLSRIPLLFSLSRTSSPAPPAFVILSLIWTPDLCALTHRFMSTLFTVVKQQEGWSFSFSIFCVWLIPTYCSHLNMKVMSLQREVMASQSPSQLGHLHPRAGESPVSTMESHGSNFTFKESVRLTFA